MEKLHYMPNMTIPIPNLSTAPPARKISGQHLANLLNSLELILNLRGDLEMYHDLSAILISMHNVLSSQLDINPDYTIKLYKALSVWFLGYIRGTRGPKEPFGALGWSLTHNCPNLFIELLPWYEGHNSTKPLLQNDDLMFCVNIIYAFLNGHRVIITPMAPNTDTITNPLGIKELPNYTNDWVNSMSRLGISSTEFKAVYEANCAKAKFNIVTTAGPNGQATWTADLDASAIMRAPDLFEAMFSFATESKLTWMMSCLVSCVPAPGELGARSSSAPIVGKIHALEEWGGKTRVVAILDYWTQALMTPLHDTVAYFVKRLEQDGTFNQDAIIAKVQRWTGDSSRTMNSFDLTAATDRIPIDIQVSLLTYLFGSDTIPLLWKQVLTNRDFQGPDGSMLRYAVGQPMGVKSSFPMLALIHHALIQIAAQKAGVPKYSDYVVIGDDNAHADAKVAEQYLAIMTSIGVDVNMSKSVLSGSDLLPAAEIAKRVFIGGKEITSVPVKALVKASKAGHLASTLQNLIVARGGIVALNNLTTFFAGLVDARSLTGLVLLNKVPTSISGLTERFSVANDNFEYSKWFKNITVTDEELERAFLYALMTEQLKRVDGLLRGTILMAETIAGMANPDPAKVWPTELYAGLSPKDRAAAIAKLPPLQWSHPITLAAQNELDRVLSHLSALRAGSKDMVNKAKSGLLDILRNSLSEIWLGEPEKANTVRRNIFNAMLSALKSMNDVDLEKKQTRALNFSLLLSHVQAFWSVSWTWGEPPVINAVKAKVSFNVKGNEKKAVTILNKAVIGNIRL